MIKLYKDLSFSYFLVTIVGALVLTLIFGSLDLNIVCGIIMFLWIFFCAAVFQRIAAKRFNKIIQMANDTCRIEDSLNRLFGVYKGRLNNKMDLVVAIHICSLLLHFGKPDLVLKFLLPYNPETVFKRKREVVYKYLYYNILTACYSRLNRKDDALNALNRAEEVLNDPYFNKRLKPEYETMQRINYLLITDDGNQVEEILSLLDESLIKSKNLLSKVSCRFSVTYTLAKHGRLDEAKEHIEFIKDNGGDTIYAKCALQNNFSHDFINEIDLGCWEPDPIKLKEHRTLIISIVSVVVMVALTLAFGFLTTKTIYVNNYNGSIAQSVLTFDKNGDILSWSMESHEYFSSESELELQYNFYSLYLILNDYKGCEVTLNEKDGVLDLYLTVDFNKTTDEIYDVLDVSTVEKDFIEANIDGEYTIRRYKEFLGVTVFDGLIK